MFRELLSVWRRRDALARMFSEFDQMLHEAHWMFQQGVEVLFGRLDWHAVERPLYERDKQVNKLERSIRAQIVKHLTFRHETNLAACLVLMSVVKDAERIGDYCKNIFEVGKFHTSEFTAQTYIASLERMRAKVEELFGLTTHAFRMSDVDSARRVQKEFGIFSKDCDQLIRQLLQQQENIPRPSSRPSTAWISWTRPTPARWPDESPLRQGRCRAKRVRGVDISHPFSILVP